MSNTQSQQLMVEWHSINWRKLERSVYKLQKRIYQASARGDVKAYRRLQKTLMKSWSARALAVRRVTQDNQGKKTAGVDGVKSLTPKQRLELTGNLNLGSKVSPTRRVWIPKPGTEEKRPLGIPTMKDRALQALVKLVLEPEWEARFEPNSYGFRAGRSCHDAIGAIFNAINGKPKYVLDADIAKCFDRINQEKLLIKLNTSPTIRRQIRAWLKAGVMDGKQLFPTSEGTPQGGVISPLRANYYATVVSKVTYSDIDHLMYQKLNAWAKHRHPKKNGKWVSKRYWQSIDGDNWVFATRKEGSTSLRLLNHADTPIVRHVKVKGESSPYDGNLVYWSTRMGNNPEMPTRVSKLLKKQKGKCTHCEMFFREDDVMEVDHIIPKSKGGKDEYKNLQLLHRHCHDTKTANNGSPGTKIRLQ